jgi:hypothetical protein
MHSLVLLKEDIKTSQDESIMVGDRVALNLSKTIK